jgi:hypothetical protein
MKQYAVGQVWSKVKDGCAYDHRRIRHINHRLAVEFEIFGRVDRGFLSKEAWEYWIEDAVLLVPGFPDQGELERLRNSSHTHFANVPSTCTADHFP